MGFSSQPCFFSLTDKILISSDKNGYRDFLYMQEFFFSVPSGDFQQFGFGNAETGEKDCILSELHLF